MEDKTLEKVMQLGNRMASVIQEDIELAKESSGDPNSLPEMQDLVREWRDLDRPLYPIFRQMVERGYSISIGEPPYPTCEWDTVYLLSMHEDLNAMAWLASDHYDQADELHVYFFFESEKETQCREWLFWVECNERGEQVADYTPDGDLAEIIAEMEFIEK